MFVPGDIIFGCAVRLSSLYFKLVEIRTEYGTRLCNCIVQQPLSKRECANCCFS
jgi:hypothetical protein